MSIRGLLEHRARLYRDFDRGHADPRKVREGEIATPELEALRDGLAELNSEIAEGYNPLVPYRRKLWRPRR